MARFTSIDGDLLDQPVEVIVNAWNRNIIPWWLLIPQGVSGAIKRRAGLAPFKEIGRTGPLPLGHARWTKAGNLPFKGIIHVAGINMSWRASEQGIRDCTRNALELAVRKGVRSILYRIIGTGSGGFQQDVAKSIMEAVISEHEFAGEVLLVTWSAVQRSLSDG